MESGSGLGPANTRSATKLVVRYNSPSTTAPPCKTLGGGDHGVKCAAEMSLESLWQVVNVLGIPENHSDQSFVRSFAHLHENKDH